MLSAFTWNCADNIDHVETRSLSRVLSRRIANLGGESNVGSGQWAVGSGQWSVAGSPVTSLALRVGVIIQGVTARKLAACGYAGKTTLTITPAEICSASRGFSTFSPECGKYFGWTIMMGRRGARKESVAAVREHF